MPTETKEDPAGLPIPEARYFEHAPEFNVGSWSPTPAGQEYPREKPSQVHLRFGTPPGNCSLVRLKSARVVDLLIDALLEHREYTWGKRSVAYQAVLDKVRNDALIEAATAVRDLATSDELIDFSPGITPAGVADAILELRGRKPTSTPVIPSKEPR